MLKSLIRLASKSHEGMDWQWSFLPPLMVYLAAGIQGLTGIVGTFYVKEHLDLSAEFLAALGFWVGIPWALKMPIGHVVDLLWKFKSLGVILGAVLIASSLLIMAQLIQDPVAMSATMSINAWYVLATLLAPIGYVIQDAVADAMTAEAVPRVDDEGQPLDEALIHHMHVTMQTLGRVAFVGGTLLVAGINLWVFSGMGALSVEEKKAVYRNVYLIALMIPLVSVLGLLVAHLMLNRQVKALIQSGHSRAAAVALLRPEPTPTQANAWLLSGSLVFVVFTVSMGLSDLQYAQEIIFMGSLLIIAFLMGRLTSALDAPSRQTLWGTALVIFCYRATPGPGPGVNWWTIDVLGFDQSFFSVLALIGNTLALIGMFALKKHMAKYSLLRLTFWLTVAGTLLSVPQLAMSLGFHEWTARHTHGFIDARFIALVDTALESPLGQIAMIPLLTWIAQSAPQELKATFFAVMTSFANLALSASQLLTKYLNQVFVISREVKTASSTMPANYDALVPLLGSATALGLAIPLMAMAMIKLFRWRCA